MKSLRNGKEFEKKKTNRNDLSVQKKLENYSDLPRNSISQSYTIASIEKLYWIIFRKHLTFIFRKLELKYVWLTVNIDWKLILSFLSIFSLHFNFYFLSDLVHPISISAERIWFFSFSMKLRGCNRTQIATFIDFMSIQCVTGKHKILFIHFFSSFSFLNGATVGELYECFSNL